MTLNELQEDSNQPLRINWFRQMLVEARGERMFPVFRARERRNRNGRDGGETLLFAPAPCNTRPQIIPSIDRALAATALPSAKSRSPKTIMALRPVFAAFARQLAGATPSKIGLALGIYGLSQGLLQMPFGLLSDRIRIVAIPRWGTFRLASMNSESVISRPVILTGFSRIRGRLHCGEAMEMQKSDQEEVVHRSR